MKIVFMGTPDFAVTSLAALIDNGYNVAAVVTATDKLGGRGGKELLTSEVKKYAISKGLKVLQPANLKSPDFLNELRSIQHDLQVVVAFRMLPESVWSLPPLGTINVHASLLPKYRGAAPINWAIIRGEKETGVTVFKLQHEIDTGNIIHQEAIAISDNDDFGSMYGKLKELGATALIKALNDIEKGIARYLKQDDQEVSHAPKIFHETCEINFSQSSMDVFNFVRGLYPFPCAWFSFFNQEMKVMKCTPIMEPHSLTPGTIHSDRKKFLKVATIDGYIELLRIKVEGKKEMDIQDFLNGYHWLN